MQVWRLIMGLILRVSRVLYFSGGFSLHSGNTTPYTNCGFVEGCKSKENKLSIEVHDERVDSFLEEGSVFFLLSIIMRYVK